jgi:pimeloyl-ACP methyl ester carboxylesterase
MPFAENQGARIYWDEQGHGPPVLLIMGLGWASDLWHRTRPVLATSYRTIAFDNRGVGRSDVPPGPYSIPLMASDAAAVLDASGAASAHLYGVSMGGMIAQEFALQYPVRVRSLILGCTAAGGPTAVRAEPEVLQALMNRGVNPMETAKTMEPFIYDPSTPPDRIAEDMEIRVKWYPSAEGYFAQLQGIRDWEAYSRLSQILAPTMLVHGESDKLIPPVNSRLIAERIPSAKVTIIPGASHIFSTDQPIAANEAVVQFLAAQS